jgi:hypothetical protein
MQLQPNCSLCSIDENALYLLQMTIAEKHNLDLQKLNEWRGKIANCLNNQHIRTEFVFVVPKHLFPSYGIGDLAIKEKTLGKLTQTIQTKIYAFLKHTLSCLFNAEQIRLLTSQKVSVIFLSFKNKL